MKKKHLLLSIFLPFLVAGMVTQKRAAASTLTLSETNRAQNLLGVFNEFEARSNDESKRQKSNQLQTLSLKLDSIVRKDSNDQKVKDVFLYDKYGNQIEEQSYYWSRNSWIAADKTETVYDESKFMTQTVSYYYQPSTNRWVNTRKTEYTYDNHHNILVDVNSVWDADSSKWIVELRSENDYNESDRLVTRLLYSWVANTKTLALRSKGTYSYNANGQKSALILYSWNAETTSWTRVGTKTYGYDENGNMNCETTILGETDALSGSSYKREISYTNNLILSDVSFYWDVARLAWTKTRKAEYSYDSNGKLLEENYSIYNSDNASWTPETQNQYEIDGNGNRTSKIERKWNDLSQGWQNISKFSCSYDQFYSDDKLLLNSHCMTSIFNSANANIPIEGMQYDWNTYANQWNTNYTLQENRYYSGISLSGLDETDTNKLKIYPNPVIDKLYIANAQAEINLTLYSLQGAMLLQSHASEVDLSHYPSGVYLLEVNGQRLKIVKK
ncbi:MAG: hypothetical protein RIS29_2430 [Bacteroidota bacterium]|jgi:hypothetical protein